MTERHNNGPTALLAEDRPEEQYTTRILLEKCGCRVIEAMSGEEAVSLALRERPDLILMDVMTPKLDGYEAARRIRRDPGLGGVPVIAYTAYYSYSLTEGALKAGFDEYLIKPVTLEGVRQLVRQYLPGTEKKGGKQ